MPAGQAPAALRGGRGLALGVLTAVLFLTFLDNTIVSVALGSVQAGLHAGVSALQWVVSAYALTFAGAMLAFGMVGDEFGRKRVMLIGVGIFCAGSGPAAPAPNIGVVIAGRAVMGFGAAASEPGTLSMLRHLYTDEQTRSRAIGVWAARICPGRSGPQRQGRGPGRTRGRWSACCGNCGPALAAARHIKLGAWFLRPIAARRLAGTATRTCCGFSRSRRWWQATGC